MGSTKRIQKMFVAVFLSRGILAVKQLLLVPLFLKFWGTEYYGEWLTISAIPVFLTMSNLGLGTAASVQIGHDVGAGNREKGWNTYVSSMAILAVFVSLMAVLLICVLSSTPLLSGFGRLESPHLVLLLLAGTTLLRIFVPPCVGWWVGLGRPNRAQDMNNVYFFCEMAIIVLVVCLGGNALQVSLSVLAWSIIWTVWFVAATLHIAEPTKSGFSYFAHDYSSTTRLLAIGIGHQLSPLYMAILFQGSILLAAKLLGAEGAALWGAMKVFVRAGFQVIEVISKSLGPEFQLAFGVGDLPKLRRLHSAGLVSSIAIACFGFVVLVAIGLQVFQIWTGNVFVVPTSAWWLYSFSVIPFSMWCVSGELQRAANSPWYLNFCGIVCAGISIAVMSSAAAIGVTGLSLGMLTFDLLMSLLIVRRSCVLLGDSFWSSLLKGLDAGRRAIHIARLC